MTRCLLPTQLLATTLLLGTLACSKKDDPSTAPTITAASKTGTYQLDGNTYTGAVDSYTGQRGTGSTFTHDVLFINIHTTPTSATEITQLSFSKPIGADFSAYKLDYVTLPITSSSNYTVRLYDRTLSSTLTKTTSGYYSGTFSATAAAQNSATPSSTMSGSFADARP